MTVWFDVDDLFFFARHNARPSGIQRLTCEVYSALVQIAPDEVRFVKYDSEAQRFCEVPWASVARTYANIRVGGTASDTALPPVEREGGRWSALRRLFGGRSRKRPVSTNSENSALPFETARPQDVLCTLGAPWHHADYAGIVRRAINDTGMRFAFLVHDLIPLLCPEFFDIRRAPNFEKSMRTTLPLVDVLLTNSKATATDLERWARREQLSLKTSPVPIPIGTGFTKSPGGALPDGLEPGGFVLFVSTIEVRKNHLQAFRVWCKLLQDLPPEKVPTLVFAGGRGWMVDDLMQAIDNTEGLKGKLRLILSPDDATLCALYEACRFTLFLSYYEGFGLPVSDSLSFGKVCVTSDRTSMPEVGRDFCEYVDPDNTTDAYRKARRLIDDGDLLKALEDKIRRDYKPVEWTTTASALLETIRATPPQN